jgi:hypothetical protein
MCKEMVIDFKKVKPHFDTITVNCKKLEPVSSVKVLGVIISNSLRGSDLTSTTTLLHCIFRFPIMHVIGYFSSPNVSY